MQEIKLYLPLTSFCNCPCIPDVIITFPFIAYNIICFRYASSCWWLIILWLSCWPANFKSYYVDFVLSFKFLLKFSFSKMIPFYSYQPLASQRNWKPSGIFVHNSSSSKSCSHRTMIHLTENCLPTQQVWRTTYISVHVVCNIFLT